MKKVFTLMKLTVFGLFVLLNFGSGLSYAQGTTGYFVHPYGINSWAWPLTVCNLFKDAQMYVYRIMVPWAESEPTDNTYSWNGPLQDALQRAATLGARLSLCVYGSPSWARVIADKPMGFAPDNVNKFAEFLTALLEFCDSRSPGAVYAVEVLNEEPTGDNWQSYDRDASWFYQYILKAAYPAIKAHDPNILVVMDGIWSGADHHLDDIYQLGCKDYFDRVNLHYYVQGMGEAEDPNNMNTIWHLPTYLRYLKYISENYNDNTAYIWITETGWRITDEVKKANYIVSTLDISRKSGFVDCHDVYLGLAGGYPSNYDHAGMIYADRDWDPTLLEITTSYYKYKEYANQYPSWDPLNHENLTLLPPASKDATITNPGFESGTTGWSGVTQDSSQKHSGSYSGKWNSSGGNTYIWSDFFTVETGKLYDIICWIKISASGPEALSAGPWVISNPGGSWWGSPNYSAVVDTRNYPNGWRKIRQRYLVPSGKTSIRVGFEMKGSGSVWVDDFEVKALNMGEPNFTTVAKKLLLQASPRTIAGDGVSMSTITVRVADENNNVDRNSSVPVTFSLNGVGTLVGTNPINASNGIAIIRYRSGTANTTVTITATSSGLTQGQVTVTLIANEPPNAPTNLRCNGAVNPTNVSDPNPELSWTFSDPNSGDVQSAYRILVADSLSNINNNIGNKWDTNKVLSSANLVTYAGTSLLLGSTYYWKVMTWDASNASGPYSQVATIGMMTGQSSNNPPLAPTNLLCNGQQNPSGLTDFSPELSWTFNDPNTGDYQSAYRLLISNSLTDINNNTGNVWDSNKVSSSLNSITYGQAGLQSGTTYYWKVMTWDSYDAQGPYSSVATFSMIKTTTMRISTTTLNFGTLEPNETKSMTFDIYDGGSGTIYSDSEWIIVSPTSFTGDFATITVNVDGSILKQLEGQWSGKVTVNSNNGTADVSVIVTATCVLVKPNPYNPEKGILTFFGSGIVPKNTRIRIYTLDGNLVKTLDEKSGKDEIDWDGTNEYGDKVVSGIYLYIYESPSEKGISKFTVIR